MPITFSQSDYPELFQSADKASIDKQSAFVLSIRSELFSLVAAAVGASLIGVSSKGWAQFWSILTIVSTVGAIASSITNRIRRFDCLWFDSRAVAESLKTLVWRYVMGVEPFGDALSDDEVEKVFLAHSKQILDTASETLQAELPIATNSDQLTAQMKSIRKSSLSERKDIYLNLRLKDQETWYANKAEFNRKRDGLWFGLILGSQILTIVLAGVALMSEPMVLNVLGVVITIVTSMVAWTQLRRHYEYTQSYSMAARELSFLRARAGSIGDQARLATFVVNVEDSISREHTKWYAKRTGAQFWNS